MKTHFMIGLKTFCACLFFCCCWLGCQSQPSFGTNYLKLEKEIPLPNVKGRIDHMDVNLKEGVVYMAALGNNTLEVIDIINGRVSHSIKGLDEPQGVGYIPQHHEIIVANGGNGDCYFYNAASFAKVATVHLSSDADDVRYDSAARKIYVGYGKGGIAVIDADNHQQVADIKLPVHPEGFQVDKGLNQLYVNLPDANVVGIVDLNSLKLVNQWPNQNLAANFPMAIDLVHHKVFIGYRHPAKVLVMDASTDQRISTFAIIGDTDDLYYDSGSHRIYASGGNGAIDIFKEEGNRYKPLGSLPTRTGARTSLLIPQLHRLVVAARAGANKEAALLVYKIQE